MHWLSLILLLGCVCLTGYRVLRGARHAHSRVYVYWYRHSIARAYLQRRQRTCLVVARYIPYAIGSSFLVAFYWPGDDARPCGGTEFVCGAVVLSIMAVITLWIVIVCFCTGCPPVCRQDYRPQEWHNAEQRDHAKVELTLRSRLSQSFPFCGDPRPQNMQLPFALHEWLPHHVLTHQRACTDDILRAQWHPTCPWV